MRGSVKWCVGAERHLRPVEMPGRRDADTGLSITLNYFSCLLPKAISWADLIRYLLGCSCRPGLVGMDVSHVMVTAAGERPFVLP